MGTTKLILFNKALVEYLNERAISSLSEDTESRRLLDKVYDGGLINFVLEQGLWNHAMRKQSLTYDPDTTVEFGYTYAFNIPTDHIRPAAISADEMFSVPLLQYETMRDLWFANHDTIYVKYVSNDSLYGADLSLWPPSFIEYVASYLALQICGKLTGSKVDKEELKKEVKTRLSTAKSKDAIAEPTQIPPVGAWAGGRGGGNRERGSRGRLIG